MTSFCPDSASTATAMASGNKTLSGVLNYNVDKTQSFKLITEYAKEAGKKIGVVTSVSLNHATPAAFYAKSESRNNYYDIGIQGLKGTTLDYLAGGAFHRSGYAICGQFIQPLEITDRSLGKRSVIPIDVLYSARACTKENVRSGIGDTLR